MGMPLLLPTFMTTTTPSPGSSITPEMLHTGVIVGCGTGGTGVLVTTGVGGGGGCVGSEGGAVEVGCNAGEVGEANGVITGKVVSAETGACFRCLYLLGGLFNGRGRLQGFCWLANS
jgi:hypothetical protein